VKHQLEETTHQKHLQKQLILDNLQELYVAFHEEHSTVLTGFKMYGIVSKTLHLCTWKRYPSSTCQRCSLECNTHGAKSSPYTWFQCKRP
jgi:hypothetical protein